MTPEFKSQWIAALRSDKYEQGRGALRTGDAFCCLGVACHLEDKFGWQSTSIGGNLDRKSWQGRNAKTLELPFIDISPAGALSTMNDSGATFAQIADFIEGSVDI